MTRTILAAVGLVALIATGSAIQHSHAQEPEPVITAGCDIPKTYGRLVNVLPGSSGGPAAGMTYAVFEAEDGVIRWITLQPGPLVANTTIPRGQIAPAFIQNYECQLAHSWKRH